MMIEYRVYCNICDKLCVERFYKNHLKSQTHTNNNHTKTISNNLTYLNMSKKYLRDTLLS